MVLEVGYTVHQIFDLCTSPPFHLGDLMRLKTKPKYAWKHTFCCGKTATQKQ